jgi:AcrR family transcriptional regulator
MSEQIGRREANKRATTEAIKHAARDLFAAKGYEATSVREIADAARVGERTFYRYFDGKEGLLADEVQRWIDLLNRTIRERPAAEPPITAVRRAFATIARLASDALDRPIWLFTNQPRPFELLQKSAPRPLLRFEEAIADGLIARGPQPPDPHDRYAAELVARVSVAVMRTVAIHAQELRAADRSSDPPLEQMLEEAFDLLAAALITTAPT